MRRRTMALSKGRKMNLTLADWWEITKRKALIRDFKSSCIGVTTVPIGFDTMIISHRNEFANWIEEMEYLYGDESDIFD